MERLVLTPEFKHDDVSVTKTKSCYHQFFEILEVKLKHKLFQGGWTPEIRRELFVRDNAVAVLLYDPDHDKVVLIEQFRVGALDEEKSPWLFEIVAGMIEPGETPECVAKREAHEEAGCEITKLDYICNYLTSPGGSSEKVFLFCGRVDSTGAEGVHGLKDEHEDTRVHVISTDDALAMIQDGRINNAATIIALQWLGLQRL